MPTNAVLLKNMSVPDPDTLPAELRELAAEIHDLRRRRTEASATRANLNSNQAVHAAKNLEKAESADAVRHGKPVPDVSATMRHAQAQAAAQAEVERLDAAVMAALTEYDRACRELAPTHAPVAMANFDQATADYENAITALESARIAWLNRRRQAVAWQGLADDPRDASASMSSQPIFRAAETTIGGRTIIIDPAMLDAMRSEIRQTDLAMHPEKRPKAEPVSLTSMETPTPSRRAGKRTDLGKG